MFISPAVRSKHTKSTAVLEEVANTKSAESQVIHIIDVAHAAQHLSEHLQQCRFIAARNDADVTVQQVGFHNVTSDVVAIF